MFSQMQDFMNEQMRTFAGQAQSFGSDPLAFARESLSYSVDGLKALEQPVRAAARSSAQLSKLAHETAQELIELQTQVATASLSEIADALQRASEAKDVAALVSVQAESVRKSAEQFVKDANRAIEILTTAGRGVQQLTVEAYESAAKTAQKSVGAAKTAGARKKTRKAA